MWRREEARTFRPCCSFLRHIPGLKPASNPLVGNALHISKRGQPVVFKIDSCSRLLYKRQLPLWRLEPLESLSEGVSKNYPSDISREQFAIIKPLLGSAHRKTAPRRVDLYEVFCAMLYLFAAHRLPVAGGAQ